MRLLAKLRGQSGKHGCEGSLEDLALLYENCQLKIGSNTPEGWKAEVVKMNDGVSYCYAETSIEGILATIPVMTRSWGQGSFINGYFGYKMIGGHPWRKRTGPHDEVGGARVTMIRENDRTSLHVYSHHLHYKEAVELGQSIVDHARSGYLKVNDASAPKL